MPDSGTTLTSRGCPQETQAEEGDRLASHYIVVGKECGG